MAATTSPAANSATAAPTSANSNSNSASNSTLHTKNLAFEKKNTNLLHIPRNYRISKRPIPHPAVASPYAGSTVAKVVYISSKTPFMSAVKRVQKLLRLAERRAMMPVIDGKQQRKKQHQLQQGRATTEKVLEQCQQRLRQDKVFVKATGRAIEKALAVGRWFETGTGRSKGAAVATGDEYEVVVRTGSVCVVDDIEENEDNTPMDEDEGEEEDQDEDEGKDKDTAVDNNNDHDTATNEPATATATAATDENLSKNQRRRRRKRERVQQQRLNAFKDEDGEPPESRTRWVNMVEIAINLK